MELYLSKVPFIELKRSYSTLFSVKLNYAPQHLCLFLKLLVVSLWKFVAENDTEKKNTATLKIDISKENATLKKFQCYFNIIFSVAFVCHINENDSRTGFSHNNS